MGESRLLYYLADGKHPNMLYCTAKGQLENHPNALPNKSDDRVRVIAAATLRVGSAKERTGEEDFVFWDKLCRNLSPSHCLFTRQMTNCQVKVCNLSSTTKLTFCSNKRELCMHWRNVTEFRVTRTEEHRESWHNPKLLPISKWKMLLSLTNENGNERSPPWEWWLYGEISANHVKVATGSTR